MHGTSRRETPFLYFPLRRHCEQNIHVRHRLERYDAGRAMDYEAETPASIGTAIAERAPHPQPRGKRRTRRRRPRRNTHR